MLIICCSSFSVFSAATNMSCQSATAFENQLSQLENVTSALSAESEKKAQEGYERICRDLIGNKDALGDYDDVPLRYQETMYRVAEINNKMSKEEKTSKLNQWWESNKAKFRCLNFPNTNASGMNIIQFSIEVNRSDFITDLIEQSLDTNYTNHQNQTVAQYLESRIVKMKQEKDTERLQYYEAVYARLKIELSKRQSGTK